MLSLSKSINKLRKLICFSSYISLTLSIIFLNIKDPRELSKVEILSYSQKSLSEYNWFKVKKMICNDEYDQWLCCDFYFSDNEKIHVVYSDLVGTDPHYVETSLNIYQKKMHVNLNDYLKNISTDGKYIKLILNDEGNVEIKEFDSNRNNKYIHIYSISCSKLLEDRVGEINDVLKKNRKLPKEFINCRIINCKIIKNFDYRDRLLDKP